MNWSKNNRKWVGALAIAGTVIAAGVSISAADQYFEITKNLEIFTELYKELNIYYVDETKPGSLMKTGIDAMLASLDPYTNFIPESDIEDYRLMTTGQYGGIGALIKLKNEEVVISEPYEGFPAQKSDVRAGDVILAVDGRDVKGMPTDEVSKLLKGQAGSSVTVRFRREGEAAPLEITLTREDVKIPDVPYYGLLEADSAVGYIKLTSFTQTASKDVRDAMKDLEGQGMQKLVLDLRGNGGGLLREAVNIVNLFVPRNQLVVETKGKIKEWDKTYKTLGEPVDLEIPLVVLVDGSSASASEIVSGALQDLDRAVVVGQRTFGKGLVQQTRDLYYNAKLKLTVAKYYIPSGRCIQKLDYASRDDAGKATSKADSLITEFKTVNGRSVYDGRGILPDVAIEDRNMSPIVASIFKEDLFFDYANEFARRNATIAPAAEFHLNDAMYEEFGKFISGHELDMESESQETLDELIEVAKREGYYAHAESEFSRLSEELRPHQSDELMRSRDDVQEVLENEIVSRYYYQTGRVRASLAKDPYIRKGLDLFSDGTYTTVLNGTYKQD